MPVAAPSAANLQVSVAIVGAGVAGISAAAALANDGVSVALIDYRDRTPPQFRAEKIGNAEVESLTAFGLGAAARAQLTTINGVWVHRFGRMASQRHELEYSSPYADLVNALRDALPPTVQHVHGRIEDVEASADEQRLRMSDGRLIGARLIVLATGPGEGLRQRLGMSSETLSPGHSLTVGFSLETAPSDFAFPSLVWNLEAPAAKVAYLTLFPMGGVMRGNLVTYRNGDDEWIAQLREDPDATLARLFPYFAPTYGPMRVVDRPQMRPVELTRVKGHYRPGVVVIGDAYFVTCPSTGTGIGKALNDVSILRQLLPRWLSTSGMAIEKTAMFYNDPRKVVTDRASLELSLKERALRMDSGLYGKMLRMRRNVLGRGWHGARQLLTGTPNVPASTSPPG